MKHVLLLACCIVMCKNIALAQKQDSVKTYTLAPVEVTARKDINLYDRHEFGTNYQSKLFDRDGFNMVRRGLDFTQDIYVEGFKGTDVKVVIDGEQYYTSCPNRMDAEATRINPLEMASVDLSKSGSLLNSGIYGKVEYHRSEIGEQLKLKSYIDGTAGSQVSTDAGAAVDWKGTSLSIRYAQGKPYENGDSKNFTDLYNYRDNYLYKFANGSLRRQSGNWKYGLSFTLGENISFPYLMMDEKQSKVTAGFVSYKGNKLYFSYTHHLMNNTLRISPMFMETDAKNFTLGLTGSFYEVTYRNWNAENVIRNPMMKINIQNKMIPDVNQLSASLVKKIGLKSVTLSLKGGIEYFRTGSTGRLNFYRNIYPDAKDDIFFATAAGNMFYSVQLNKTFTTVLSLEAATEAPEAKELFIALQRPGTNPYWSGNPLLSQPVRLGIRALLNSSHFTLESFLNRVHNYVNITRSSVGGRNYMTYENINALLFGINASVKFRHIESSLSYLYGENTTNSSPLSEISPFSVTTTLRAPEFYGIFFSLTHRYENAQKRIDTNLNEVASQAWNIIGIKADFAIKSLVVTLEANNILNNNYYRFLSYSRDPFSSGARVYDPGRTIRLTVSFDSLL